ncbi:hypothetical protein [Shewanella sp. NIFS-20-20]|uniref:hypothetical protein n=1 Tax=Shewanella sp. NIFS-20-20 TaxID=2853806 RepID=UPI001C489A78|nr:hypothetical protein [Shewanella sp. NIFS-20-20]MBV7315294.1 hypothetical protein [Shewanella sp. NIFS-20-20]
MISIRMLHQLTCALITIVLLQFVATNSGAHQLHLDASVPGEESSHPHLTFNAPVLVEAACIQCQCNLELESAHAAEPAFFSHQHQSVEWQSFDLCLDCQCHGGGVMLLSFMPELASTPASRDLQPANLGSLLTSATMLYRPPIS